MSNPLPNALALTTINDGDQAQAAPLRNNYAAIQTAVNLLRAALAGGTAGQVLQAVDGTDVQYGIVPGQVLVKGKKTSSVSSSGTTFGTGNDLLAADLTFTADGTSDYAVIAVGRSWAHSVAGSAVQVNIKLDGGDAGQFGQIVSPGAAVGDTLNALGVIPAPAAGAHTVNARIFVAGAGTGTVAAGAGGVGASTPLAVMVVKLG